MTSYTGLPKLAMTSRGKECMGDRSRLAFSHLTMKSKLESDIRGLGGMAFQPLSAGAGSGLVPGRVEDGLGLRGAAADLPVGLAGAPPRDTMQGAGMRNTSTAWNGRKGRACACTAVQSKERHKTGSQYIAWRTHKSQLTHLTLAALK